MVLITVREMATIMRVVEAAKKWNDSLKDGTSMGTRRLMEAVNDYEDLMLEDLSDAPALSAATELHGCYCDRCNEARGH